MNYEVFINPGFCCSEIEAESEYLARELRENMKEGRNVIIAQPTIMAFDKKRNGFWEYIFLTPSEGCAVAAITDLVKENRRKK
jgi:hypothetical protein